MGAVEVEGAVEVAVEGAVEGGGRRAVAGAGAGEVAGAVAGAVARRSRSRARLRMPSREGSRARARSRAKDCNNVEDLNVILLIYESSQYVLQASSNLNSRRASWVALGMAKSRRQRNPDAMFFQRPRFRPSDPERRAADPCLKKTSTARLQVCSFSGTIICLLSAVRPGAAAPPGRPRPGSRRRPQFRVGLAQPHPRRRAFPARSPTSVLDRPVIFELRLDERRQFILPAQILPLGRIQRQVRMASRLVIAGEPKPDPAAGGVRSVGVRPVPDAPRRPADELPRTSPLLRLRDNGPLIDRGQRVEMETVVDADYFTLGDANIDRIAWPTT